MPRSRPAIADGFRSTRRQLWTSAGDGVHCITPDGDLIGKIPVPEKVANVVFGGPKRNRLFICGSTSLYAIYVNGKALSGPEQSLPAPKLTTRSPDRMPSRAAAPARLTDIALAAS